LSTKPILVMAPSAFGGKVLRYLSNSELLRSLDIPDEKRAYEGEVVDFPLANVLFTYGEGHRSQTWGLTQAGVVPEKQSTRPGAFLAELSELPDPKPLGTTAKMWFAQAEDDNLCTLQHKALSEHPDPRPQTLGNNHQGAYGQRRPCRSEHPILGCSFLAALDSYRQDS
jgi:hypothetical protein